MSKVSIIVPVYKVEKYLDKCVDSIVNQTYKDIEIILVDDGSPDNCPKMCDDWAIKDDRIKVIHKENGGLSDARNTGLEVSTGDYVGFVDGDDVVSNVMYEKLIDLISNSNSQISMCQFARFIEGNSPNYTIKDDVSVFGQNEALKEILKEKIGNHVCNKLFKRELFDNISFTKGVAYEDIFIFYKLVLKANKIAITDSKLYGYMQRRDSITNKCTVKNVRDYLKANKTRYEELKGKEELTDYLNISVVKGFYILNVKAASTKEESFFFSDELVSECKFFRKIFNSKYLKDYLEDGNIKTKVYKIILLVNRRLFWKLLTRKNENIRSEK